MRGDSDRKLGLLFVVVGLVAWLGLSALWVHIGIDGMLPRLFQFEFMCERETRLAELSERWADNRMNMLLGLWFAAMVTVPVVLLGVFGWVFGTRKRSSSPGIFVRTMVRRSRMAGWGLFGFGVLLGTFAATSLLNIHLTPHWFQDQAEYMGRAPTEARWVAGITALEIGATVFAPYALLALLAYSVTRRLHKDELHRTPTFSIHRFSGER